ncbi:hypothetical protein K502DRAFT_324612 [Neoconidiobolus thromboides FSU 785]|nr:hypothetical protein K502DRAFT_324612 [Neoconidiobolus thromboides FSU 785]
MVKQNKEKEALLITMYQKYVLTSYFKIDPKPCSEIIKQIAMDAKLYEKHVRKWFSLTRKRLREDSSGEYTRQFNFEWNTMYATYSSTSPTRQEFTNETNLINVEEDISTTSNNETNNSTNNTTNKLKVNPLSIKFLLKDQESEE